MEQPPARTRRRRPPRWSVAVAAAAVLLTGCGGDPDPTRPTGARAEADEGLRYVALGDSFTAAPGVPETDTETFCLRSNANYPSLVAEELDADLVDVSCSGARSEHMVTPQFYGGARHAPQFEALSRDTDLVTVSIGGNDFDVFGTLIGTCSELADLDHLAEAPGAAPCRTSMRADGGDVLLDRVARVRDRVARVVRGVRERAPEAEVLVVGYPQLVPEAGSCPALPLAPGDYPYARSVNRALATALEEAAAATDAGFVDLWRPSEGHDICAAEPWINGAGLDPTALPFHPFPAEQRAVAELVVAEVERRR